MGNEIIELNGEFEFKDFIKEGIVLIDFFAEWCMPCMTMIPIVEDIANHFDGKLKVGKIDVSENQDLAVRYGVVSIPNFIVFKNGVKAEQFVGAVGFEDLVEKLEKYF